MQYNYITKHMTQEELKEQLLFLCGAPIKNINYHEFNAMFDAWEKPVNKYGIREFEDEDYKKIITKWEELRFYYV